MSKLESTDQEMKGIFISMLHVVKVLGKQIIWSVRILSFKSLERSLLLCVLF